MRAKYFTKKGKLENRKSKLMPAMKSFSHRHFPPHHRRAGKNGS